MIAQKWEELDRQDQITAVQSLADGTRSTRVILEELSFRYTGITTGSIAGIIRRSGGKLTGRKGAISSTKWVKGSSTFQQSLEARLQAPDSLPVTLLEITDKQCRRPMWSGEPPLDQRFYCGAPVDLRQTYCEHCQTFLYEQKGEAE
ncbi:hypothetical protein PsAD13_03207 [Pseudovibrio sp. Ad13]|uniref:hypothetical protein n=1 Tax=Pseudovibrio sp. Ad13 TaxID=989396 RepID=UPI0007AE69ED|nr:hypothetical protein [Pseudovibrio sp. Ad13]KZK83005.1 hypothetical protein PsAD13_03207 [Pseudovibrio sp. Ad13]